MGRWCIRGFALWVLTAVFCVSIAGAWPAGVDHSVFSDGPGDGEDRPGIGLDTDAPGKQDAAGKDSRATTIVGVSLFGSGIFLCSWGIASWEIEEYQCCPARNTGNVVKIVAGVLLINAGLIYLLDVQN